MRYAIILAGGSGTRLWPLSNESLPKQLAPIAGGRSLMEAAYTRLEGLVPEERRFICGAARYREATFSRLPSLSIPSVSGLDRYIGEPEGRDTLAAIALSSALIGREDPEALVAVLTSDHVIEPEEEFRALLDKAFQLVETDPDLLVTFGVKPDRPATGFGYLELGDPIGNLTGARRVIRFREKPDAESAAAFVEAGPDRYLWNSGMFVWRTGRFLELASRYEPELTSAVSRIAAAAPPGLDHAMASAYPSLKKISVDYGVMEKASRDSEVRIAALPLAITWKDIGSWIAYGDLMERDGSDNRRSGETALVDCRGTIVLSSEEDHLVACLGCEDMVVIHTAGATLVCPKSRADELKKLHTEVAKLREGKYR